MQIFKKTYRLIARIFKRQPSYKEIYTELDRAINEYKSICINQSIRLHIELEFKTTGWQIIDMYPSDPDATDHIQVKAKKDPDGKLILPNITGYCILHRSVNKKISIFNIIPNKEALHSE